MVMHEVGQFAKLKDDSLAEYGYAKGSFVLLVGSGFVPDSKNDPYKYRLMFVAAPIVDGHIKIEENGKPNGYTIDGSNLKKVTKPELKKLEKNREDDFGGAQVEQAADPAV